MKLLGAVDFAKELQGQNIYRLQNVLTLDVSAHCRFDTLDLWLMPEDEEYSSAIPLPLNNSWIVESQVIKPLLFDSKVFQHLCNSRECDTKLARGTMSCLSAFRST